MEPCGFILDLMVPALRIWLKLTGAAKVEALKQEERIEKEEFLKKTKDARDGCKISRGSKLVQERAHLIERSLEKAMRIASQYGLGISVE